MLSPQKLYVVPLTVIFGEKFLPIKSNDPMPERLVYQLADSWSFKLHQRFYLENQV
jgi:hypothetical protein